VRSLVKDRKPEPAGDCNEGVASSEKTEKNKVARLAKGNERIDRSTASTPNCQNIVSKSRCRDSARL
jgi:hypothetical protein